MVIKKGGGAGDEPKSTVRLRRIRRERIEMIKVVLQKGQFWAEESRGRSEAVGRSAVARSTEVLHSTFDGSGVLDAVRWRTDHAHGFR